jgi:hypothetical protein
MSGFIAERWWDGSSQVIDFTVGWGFCEPQPAAIDTVALRPNDTRLTAN